MSGGGRSLVLGPRDADPPRLGGFPGLRLVANPVDPKGRAG